MASPATGNPLPSSVIGYPATWQPDITRTRRHCPAATDRHIPAPTPAPIFSDPYITSAGCHRSCPGCSIDRPHIHIDCCLRIAHIGGRYEKGRKQYPLNEFAHVRPTPPGIQFAEVFVKSGFHLLLFKVCIKNRQTKRKQVILRSLYFSLL